MLIHISALGKCDWWESATLTLEKAFSSSRKPWTQTHFQFILHNLHTLVITCSIIVLEHCPESAQFLSLQNPPQGPYYHLCSSPQCAGSTKHHNCCSTLGPAIAPGEHFPAGTWWWVMEALNGAMFGSRELGFCIATLGLIGAALAGSPPGWHSCGRTTGCKVGFAKITLFLLLKYHYCGIAKPTNTWNDWLRAVSAVLSPAWIEISIDSK